jgi:Flp pilus assembly protein TadG
MRRRGATFVETAFIIVPLIAIPLAIIDFAFAIFLRSTFQHAVREGVRFAVTSRTLPGMGHDASIKRVVQQNALGFLEGEEGAAKIHITYIIPGTMTETASNAGGNIVEVAVENYTWRWMGPLMRAAAPALALTARSSDRMEASPGGVPPER